MGDEPKSGDNSKARAVQGANDLVDRLQDEAIAYLKPAASMDEREDAVAQMIGDLEAAPEVRQLREAGGEDPAKFGSAENPEGKAPRRVYDEHEHDDGKPEPFPGPDAIALEAEIASLEDDFGKLDTVEALEHAANEISAGVATYDGGPIVARAVAAELRRRAIRLRSAGGFGGIAADTSIGAADFSKETHDRVTGPAIAEKD